MSDWGITLDEIGLSHTDQPGEDKDLISGKVTTTSPNGGTMQLEIQDDQTQVVVKSINFAGGSPPDYIVETEFSFETGPGGNIGHEAAYQLHYRLKHAGSVRAELQHTVNHIEHGGGD